jgi:hypothetical protein
MAVHAEPAHKASRRTLATLLLQWGEPATMRPAISQGRDSDVDELRKSIRLCTVTTALFENEQSQGRSVEFDAEGWGLMLAPWDQRVGIMIMC